MRIFRFASLALLLLTVFSLVIPAEAYSGYLMAPYPSSWTITCNPDVHCQWDNVEVDEGTGDRWWIHINFNNVGTFPLYAAVVTTRVVSARLSDGSIITDPTWLKANVLLLNLDGYWDQGGYYNTWYVISLGTIQPGHSKHKLMNWYVPSDVVGWTYRIAVWYLPTPP